MAKTALLCAGGTGGHLFPAEALARALIKRGWRIELATDHRATSYGVDFPAEKTHIVPSATPSGQKGLKRLGAMARLAGGAFRSLLLLMRVRPTVAVGFGGYPTVPPILAATRLRIPTIIHDQNAVLGRANRFLARRVTRIAKGSAALKLPDSWKGKAVLTGNPVRPAVRDAAAMPYPPLEPDGPIHLLVFGGSQGARFFSEMMPGALAALPAELRSRLRLVQQCRPEDLEGVRRAYAELAVEAELEPFFRDLPNRIAQSHLVIARAGASTVAELAVIGRPSILVPLPHAIDQDQKANAKTLVFSGGAWMIDQAELSPERMGAELEALFSRPELLRGAAVSAGKMGHADAAERLADLVEAVAAQRKKKTGSLPAGTKQGAR